MVLGYCRSKVVEGNPEFPEDEPSNPEDDDYDEEVVENTGPGDNKSPPQIKSKGLIFRALAQGTVVLPCEVENTSEFYTA